MTMLATFFVVALAVVVAATRWWLTTDAPGAVIGHRLLNAITAAVCRDRQVRADAEAELGAMIDAAAADGRPMAAIAHGASSIRTVQLRRSSVADAMGGRRLPTGFVAGWVSIALATTVLHFVVDPPPGEKSPLYRGVELATLVVLAAAVGRRGADLRCGSLAIGIACFVAGDIAYAALEPASFPSVVDGLYVSMYPMLGTGALLMIRRAGGRTVRWLALAMLTSALAGLAWWFGTGMAEISSPLLDKVVVVGYESVDLGLIVLAIGAIVAPRRDLVAATLLLVAFTSLAVADAGYVVTLAGGTFTSGLWMDSFWLAFLPLASAAVACTASPHVHSPPTEPAALA